MGFIEAGIRIKGFLAGRLVRSMTNKSDKLESSLIARNMLTEKTVDQFKNHPAVLSVFRMEIQIVSNMDAGIEDKELNERVDKAKKDLSPAQFIALLRLERIELQKEIKRLKI